MFFLFLFLDQVLAPPPIAKAMPANTTFHVGTVIEVTREATRQKPVYRVFANFGSILGVRQAALKRTEHEDPQSLLGLRIAGVTRMGAKNCIPDTSFHLLGTHNETGAIVVQRIEENLPNGTQIFF